MKVILSQSDSDQRIEYFVDEDKVLDHLEEKVRATLNTTIKLPGGPVIDLSRRSLLTTGLRQVCAMLIMPMLTWFAEQNNVYIPPKEKHGDIIQYCVDLYFRIARSMFRQVQVVCDDAPYVDDMRTITHAKLEKEESGLPLLMFPMAGKDLPNNYE